MSSFRATTAADKHSFSAEKTEKVPLPRWKQWKVGDRVRQTNTIPE
jgi:hypothetical protein